MTFETINRNTEEGALLSQAVCIIASFENFRNFKPNSILSAIRETREEVFKDGQVVSEPFEETVKRYEK